MPDALLMQALLAANTTAAPVPKAPKKPEFTVQERILQRGHAELLPVIAPEENPYNIDLNLYNREDLGFHYQKAYIVYDTKNKVAGVIAAMNHENGQGLHASLGEGVDLVIKDGHLAVSSDTTRQQIPLVCVKEDYGNIYIFGPEKGRACSVECQNKTDDVRMMLNVARKTNVVLGADVKNLEVHLYDKNGYYYENKYDTRVSVPPALLKDAPDTKNTFSLARGNGVVLSAVDTDGNTRHGDAYVLRLANGNAIKAGFLLRDEFQQLPGMKLSLSVDGQVVPLMDTRAAVAEAERIKKETGKPLEPPQELDLLNKQLLVSEELLKAYKNPNQKAPENGHGLLPLAPVRKEAVKEKGGR